MPRLLVNPRQDEADQSIFFSEMFIELDVYTEDAVYTVKRASATVTRVSSASH